jgi:hypothetical protein
MRRDCTIRRFRTRHYQGGNVVGVVADEVWDEWETRGREFESIDLVVRSNLAPEETYRRVRAAFDAAFPDEQWPAELRISPTVHGAGLCLLNCEELTDLLFPAMARFGEMGVSDPRIELFPDPTMKLLSPPELPRFLECGLALHASQRPSERAPARHWDIGPDLLTEIYARTANWCLDLPQQRRTAYICSGMLAYPVPEPQLAHWFSLAVQAVEPLASAWLVVESEDGTFRLADLEPASAHLSLVDGAVCAPGFGWLDSLNALRGALNSFAADWARSGFIKRGCAWQQLGSWTFGAGNWVPIPHKIPGHGPYQRATQEDHILDACGVLILDKKTAERLPRTPTWTIEPLGTHNVLVQHHDLEAWFRKMHPDQHTLDTARADLHDLLPPQHDTAT